MRASLLIVVLLVGVMNAAGCVPVVPVAEVSKEKDAQHQRELQLTREAASASATQRSIQKQQQLIEQIKKESFDAGRTTGRGEGINETLSKVEDARESGLKMGAIKGEQAGIQVGLDRGEKLGRAKAVAEDSEKWIQRGEKVGEIKGRTAAAKEHREELKKTDAAAEKRGIAIGETKGIGIGREQEARYTFARILTVAISVSSTFVALLYFVVVKRDPSSARGVKLQLDRERLELARIQMKQEERDERFLKLIEQMSIVEPAPAPSPANIEGSIAQKGGDADEQPAFAL